jgi:acetyl-CoA carboxylase alpha subunit
MVNILSFIGLVTVIKFCIKHRRVFMNREEFCKAVKRLRLQLLNGYTSDAHHTVDNIVHNVLGEKEMDVEKSEKDLVAHIAQHIQEIKKAKEQDKLEEKAEKIISQIKAMLDE